MNMNLFSNIKKVFCRKGLSSFILYTLYFIVSASLFSCTDDLAVTIDNNEPGENFTGITLFIPDVNNAAEFGATRGDEYVNTRAYDQAKEGNFNTLYIVAIDESKKAHIFLRNESDGIVEEIYSRYYISLPAGKYKFYVVANFNRYLFKDNGDNTTFYEKVNEADDPEKVIRELILEFTSSRPLEPGFLPMACLNENIRVGANKSDADRSSIDENGYVTVPTYENIYVYADLNYLCAKVRYTILFDRSHSEFGSDDVIDVHRNTNSLSTPYATNIRKETTIKEGNPVTDFITETSGESLGATSQWDLYLDRYIYNPEKKTELDFYTETDADKIKAALDGLEAWSSSKGEWSTAFKNMRAWQGVTYLPENLIKDNPTLLKFPYSFNNVEGAEPKIMTLDWTDSDNENLAGIKRSTMYDIYAIIKSPDAEQWSVNVIPQPWSLEELTYHLHGPYELIVETTEVPSISLQESAVFWFRSDVPPSEIGFVSPQVSINNTPEVASSMRDIFIGGVVKNEDGTYAKNENGDYLFQVSLNEEIPYNIFYKFISDSKENEGYTIKDISFFHIVAGSLYKRIEIKDLDLKPYLNVSPQTIIIDTRELYTSPADGITYNIRFDTNVSSKDVTDGSVSLTLSDPSKLNEGKGDGALKMSNPGGFRLSGTVYQIDEKSGIFPLTIKDIISGNTYWNENNEYTLTFTLNAPGLDEPIVKVVTIKVRPFNGTYVIHFRDNTKDWEQAHIYIFQDLTLPSDMQYIENGVTKPYEYAGKIVGYVEENPTSGFQWNAAVQFVFTNNMAFRGWHGSNVMVKKDGKFVEREGFEGENVYGGPDGDVINNPWAEAHYNTIIPTGDEKELTVDSPTYGFVIFGVPDERLADQSFNHNYKDKWFKFWNYDYAYNKTYMLEPNGQRHDRYNYDIDFNLDHRNSGGDWNCSECTKRGADQNGSDDFGFYPGVAMEKEADGWWKYTLTGVAQPGRTVIIFANWHEPWNPEHKWFDFAAEDYRWPGDYEAGLPLFDFEDNEGWFLFDGNTSNNDQQFTDERPTTKETPHNFNATITSNMQVEIKIPSAGEKVISSVTANGVNGSKGTTDVSRGVVTYNFSGINSNSSKMDIVVNYSGNSKTYKVNPKFFKKSSSGYVTAQPLYLEYAAGIKLYVKWNDQVQPNKSYWKDYEQWRQTCFYVPPTNGGSNYLNVYWGEDETWNNKMASYHFTDKEIGNYKHIDVTTTEPSGNVKDKLELRLCTTESGDNRYWKVLNVEDLPQYYYPAADKYMINWHLLTSPYDPPTN